MYMNESKHTCIGLTVNTYGVAKPGRLPKNIGLFCKRALYKRLYSAKEPCKRDYQQAYEYIYVYIWAQRRTL